MRVSKPHTEEMKRITIAAFILSHDGKVLLMKPSFKDGWLLPGGGVERGEYPRETWKRVIEEELGLKLSPERLLCIDYRKASLESVIMVFSTRVIMPEDELEIRIPTGEFSEFRMVTLEEAASMLRERAAKRLPYCIESLQKGTTAYVEEGGLASRS